MPATIPPHRAANLARIVEHLYFRGYSFWAAMARVIALDRELDK